MLQMWLRYVACMLQYLCNVRTEFDENFTPGVKSPVDFKYGVRIDVWDPQPRQPLMRGEYVAKTFHLRHWIFPFGVPCSIHTRDQGEKKLNEEFVGTVNN